MCRDGLASFSSRDYRDGSTGRDEATRNAESDGTGTVDEDVHVSFHSIVKLGIGAIPHAVLLPSNNMVSLDSWVIRLR